MPKVTLARQPDTLDGFQLTDPGDMMTVLKQLAPKGYAGHINCAPGSPAVWSMGLQTPGNNISQSAAINDWVVLKNNSIAEVVPAALFSSLYTVV